MLIGASKYLLIFTLIVCSILLDNRFASIGNGINLIWMSNAILLASLLLAPRWKWSRYSAVGFAALVAGNCLAHAFSSLNIVFCALNTLEALGAAWFLRSRSTQLPRFTDPRYLLRFAGIAILGCPALSAGIFSIIASLWMRQPILGMLLHWILADGLGIAVVTPMLVAVYRARLSSMHLSHPDLALLAFAGVLGYWTFSGPGILLLFAIYPVLALAVLRLGQGWGALALFTIAGEASWFTLQDRGPFSMQFSTPGFHPHPSVLLQTFMASGIFLIYAVSSVVDALRHSERRAARAVSTFNLIAANLRDIVILADFDGRRTYVSASASEWGGWKTEELLRSRSLDMVHPSDVPAASNLLQSIRNGGDGGLIECRIRRKNGDCAWVEANVRPVRDPATGITTGVLNIVRDVSARKAAEKKLCEAYRTLEALAITDSLTRLANRRHFDQQLNLEWRRCIREQSPISLLLLDVDLFKSYNDTYGHLRGDSALQQVAESATDAITRTGDLVARFGGEEFAVILPNTPLSGAMRLAEKIRHSVQERHIKHVGKPLGIVTVSIGCATMVPLLGQYAALLIERADIALYGAKKAGRNRVCSSGDCVEEREMQQTG